MSGAYSKGMSNATPSAQPAAVTVEIAGPAFPNALTRENRYAYKAGGGRLSMSIGRLTNSRGKVVVSWNVDRGAGWRTQGWKATHTTEAEAFAFAGTKWATMLAWLDALVPVDSRNGAAEAFSTQVAGMSY